MAVMLVAPSPSPYPSYTPATRPPKEPNIGKLLSTCVSIFVHHNSEYLFIDFSSVTRLTASQMDSLFYIQVFVECETSLLINMMEGIVKI